MRTKSWLVSAALAALGATACDMKNINGPITIRLPPSGTVVGSVTDTSGSCIVRYDLIASGPTTIPVGGQVTLTVFPSPNRSDCPTEQNFQWEAEHAASVVTVVSVNPVTGRVTGVAPHVGENVCAVSTPGRVIIVCTDITVTGTTSSTVTITPSGSSSLFPTACPSAGATTALLTANMSVTWSSDNPSIATVSPASGTQTTVTGQAAGTTTIRATSPSGQVATHTVVVAACPTTGLTLTPSGNLSLFPTSCPGAGSTTAVITANMSVTWSSSNPSVATVNPASGTQTTVSGLAAGTTTITATGPQGQTATRTVTVTACPPQGITVTVSPATWSLVVGQQPITLTCTVSNLTVGQSPACTWVIQTPNGGNCITLTQTSSTTAVVQAIAGCTQSIEVRAFSVADTSKFGSSTGTTSSGIIVCVITWNGTTTGTITVGVNQNTTVTASCTNQFGATFTPYWYADKGTSVVSVIGSTTSVTIGGIVWPAGPQATLRGVAVGTDTITAQAAVTDVRVLTSRPVTVQ